ncbi:MAG: hypothetical protein WC878_04970 [Candidatus Paceibacterota bacterium]|jgi:hypothetical protein
MENKKNKNADEEKEAKFPPAFFPGLKISESIKSEHSVFYDVPEHPELIARQCFMPKGFATQVEFELADLPEYVNGTPEEKKKMVRKKRAELLIKNALEFQKMGKQYGLKITETSYAIGEDPKSQEPEIFAVSDRIVGEDLEAMPHISEEMKDELDAMYVGVFSQLKDSYSSVGIFWSDFKNSQIVYGAKYGKTEKHPYIIDVDPMMFHWIEQGEYEAREKDRASRENEYILWRRVYSVFTYMEQIEEKMPPEKFEKARKLLEGMLKEVPQIGTMSVMIRTKIENEIKN